jgi:hypothetical protein
MHQNQSKEIRIINSFYYGTNKLYLIEPYCTTNLTSSFEIRNNVFDECRFYTIWRKFAEDRSRIINEIQRSTKWSTAHEQSGRESDTSNRRSDRTGQDACQDRLRSVRKTSLCISQRRVIEYGHSEGGTYLGEDTNRAFNFISNVLSSKLLCDKH